MARISGSIIEHLSTMKNDEHLTADRFYAAQNYFIWMNSFPKISDAISPIILAQLDSFFNYLKVVPIEKLDYGTNYPVEIGLVKALVNENNASNLMPNQQVREFLNSLFNFDDEKLRRTELIYVRDEWKKRLSIAN